MSKEIPVQFPNDSAPVLLKEEHIGKWKVQDEKTIGDTVFFSTGGIYVSMKLDHFKEIFKK